MTLDDLRRTLVKHSWSKDVVVWVGRLESLDTILQGFDRLELDLLELVPAADAGDDWSDALEASLDDWLCTARSAHSGRIVLLVKSAALLARYRISLRPFYDWFGGAHSMVILHVGRLGRFSIPASASRAISYDPDRVMGYFRPLLTSPDRVIVEAV